MFDEIKAFAKINLHLRVLNRREDGYHNIFSIMASVGLYDLLKLSLDGESADFENQVDIRCTGGVQESVLRSIPVSDNLIAKAAGLYLEEAGRRDRVSFLIEKNIPSGAGLGGGSSDAAAALKLLNLRLRALGDDGLRRIALKVGADVPFCLHGGTAICRGTGELITPVQGKLRYKVIVANNGIHIETKRAYSLLKRDRHRVREDDEEAKAGMMASALASGSIDGIIDILANDFEEPVFREHPSVGQLKKRMYDFGAVYATMTGSGSSVIGLFSDDGAAERAVSRLKNDATQVLLTEFI